MGKNLIQQKRGKGSMRYRAHSFNYKGECGLNKLTEKSITGKIIDIIHCRGHNCPLINVKYETGEEVLMIAPEDVRVGEIISSGNDVEIKRGNVLPLKNIPEGTSIFNIEIQPGDGGKMVKSSGGFAKVTTRTKNRIIIKLPSNKKKEFNPEARACIGVIAGGGRPDKPFLKAGKRYFAKKAKNKLWPKVCGTSMNSVDHPFGGSSSGIKGRPTQSSRNAPPGRKVGKIAPRRTGFKR